MAGKFIKAAAGFLVLILAVGYLVFSKKSEPEQVALKPENFEKISFVPNKRGVASAPGRASTRASALLYKVRDDATDAEKRALSKALASFDIQVEKKAVNEKVQFARAKRQQGASEEAMAQALQATGAVEFAEPDRLVTPHFIPNDSYYTSQWHHEKINSPAAWDNSLGQPTVIVATCDTGVDANHADLKANLLPGYNSQDGARTNLVPTNAHGTMTAGAMGTVINNKLGVAGVAGNIRILPIRISNMEDGSAYFSAITSCIEYAANQGAKVVNLSYGGTNSAAVDLAAQHLRAKGGLLVVSGGNDGKDISVDPDFTSFIMVGSTDSGDNKTPWSNFGPPIDMVAPGVDIMTSTLGNTYAYGTGSSFSAPLVSGAAALIYSINPKFTPDQVEDILFESARPLGRGVEDPYFGSGLLDVGAAVSLAKNKMQVPTPRPEMTPAPPRSPRARWKQKQRQQRHQHQHQKDRNRQNRQNHRR